jgi:hypothetical protein
MEESLATFDLKSYARRGAEARVTELNAELESIFTAFPDLRSSTRGRKAGRKVVVNHEEQATGSGAAEAKLIKVEETGRVGRRRRKMTAAERKAVGERMRKYWAARKKAAR